MGWKGAGLAGQQLPMTELRAVLALQDAGGQAYPCIKVTLCYIMPPLPTPPTIKISLLKTAPGETKLHSIPFEHMLT